LPRSLRHLPKSQTFCDFSLGKTLASGDVMSASYEAIFPSLRTVKPTYPPPSAYESPSSSGAAPANDSFAHDVMEILNPLQHIPVVSMIYRHMTGDRIGPMERIAGDTLYGGVIGLASSVAEVAFEKLTGKDFGDTALAMLGVSQDKPTAVAANATAAQPTSSRVADSAPAQLIPISAKMSSSSTVRASAPSIIENSTLMDSLNRNGTGLDLGSPAAPAVTTSALDDTNASALVASLNRNGIGLDLNSAAPTVASVTPLVPVATKPGALNDVNANALMASLNRDGIGTDMGLRAMYAYRKSLALPANGTSTDATLH
jgi:hypothetical protein